MLIIRWIIHLFIGVYDLFRLGFLWNILFIVVLSCYDREKGYLEQAAQAVGGDGFDVIIENASDINLGSDLTVIGPGARVVVMI